MTLPRLFILSPGTLAPDDVHSFELAARSLAGLDLALLLREPNLLDGVYLRLARALAPHVALFLHDRPHLVEAAGARGCHVGFRSLAPADARRVGDFTLGLSTHADDDPATWSDADYLFHGPVRPTAAKAGLAAPIEPVGFQGLACAVERAGCAVLALGGLTPADVRACRDAGARGLAVLGGVWGDDWRRAQPAAAAGAYVEALAALDATDAIERVEP